MNQTLVPCARVFVFINPVGRRWRYWLKRVINSFTDAAGRYGTYLTTQWRDSVPGSDRRTAKADTRTEGPSDEPIRIHFQKSITAPVLCGRGYFVPGVS